MLDMDAPPSPLSPSRAYHLFGKMVDTRCVRENVTIVVLANG